jgi:hypothetical protein
VAPHLQEWLAEKKHREVLMLKEDRKLQLERNWFTGAGPHPDHDDKEGGGRKK